MLDPLDFRRCMGRLPTGVTIITADHPASGPTGMAVSSFTSVSLDPPLVLVCPARSSETWPQIRESGSFCANVLADHQEELCRSFARKGVDRFLDVPWHARSTGPGLDEAAAWLECVIRDEHQAGDHTIVVAEVVGLDVADGPWPLVFYRGSYGRLADARQPGRGAGV
jgi:flavin reductase (DIM6/NTAB) family NADH-FMN oxidoreductase RutF